MGHYLLVDFGSTFTKLTAVDLESEDIIATAKAITTVETNIIDGFNVAYMDLVQHLDPQLTFEKTIACSSAAGGLKMAAIGLVEELTTEAARRVCLGAGEKVELVFSHHMTSAEVQSIIDHKIDIILLAGGANGGNTECVIHNARMIADSKIMAPIIFAGNKDATDTVNDILSRANKSYHLCENVMPKLNQLNIESAKNKIKEIFVSNIIEAKGIKKAQERIDGVILPTPNAVLMASELLSKGFDEESGLGELMLVDVGGATTDVYSMADGLPKQMNAILSGLEEPFAKRTVEGDLGMRYSATGIIEAMSQAELSHFQKQGIDIVLEAKKRNHDIAFIPMTEGDFNIEHILASKCIDAAISRHVGTVKGVYTPMGMMYHQTGKDLTETKVFIGTGGVLINDKNPIVMLKAGLYHTDKPLELRPKRVTFMIDHDYILSAMGLLSIDYPEIALRILKKRIIPLGDYHAT